MKPTHYFVKTGHELQAKNKLQLDFIKYLKSLNGTLITADNLQSLIKTIRQKLQELNDTHSRCTPITINFEELYTKNGLILRGFYVITFEILKAQLTEL